MLLCHNTDEVNTIEGVVTLIIETRLVQGVVLTGDGDFIPIFVLQTFKQDQDK